MTPKPTIEFHSRHYRVLFPFIVGAAFLGWFFEAHFQSGSSFDSGLLLSTTVAIALLAVAFWSGSLSRRATDVTLCLILGAFFLLRIGATLFVVNPLLQVGSGLTEFAFFLPVYYGFAFLWLGVELGRAFSIGHIVLALTIGGVAVALGRISTQDVYPVSMLYLSMGISIFLFDVLAMTLIEYGAEKRTLQKQVVTDHLTEIANRRSLTEKLHDQLAQAERYGTPFSVLLLDIDHFKNVNDEFGHDVGDLVLQRFASLLEQERRAVDAVGRWGGEEFMVIVSNAGGDESAVMASRLRQAIAQAEFPRDASITISVGVASYARGDTVNSILKRADAALYGAKRGGRNRVERSSPPSSQPD